MNPLLKAEAVSYSIDSKQILSDITFNLNKGEVLGVAGESGSGKTTLGKILTGIIKQTSGTVIFNGRRKKKISPVQILFQNNGEIINPFRRINDMVTDVIKIKLKEEGIPLSNELVHARMKSTFNEVNLEEHLWCRKGSELSGGEQQRAALARILAAEPEVIILDEPFSAQDPDSQKLFLSLFQKINTQSGVTMICISHDIKLLRELCSRLIIIYNGKIIEQGNSEELFIEPKHDYTKFLIRAESYDLSYDDFVTSDQRKNKLLC